MHDNDWIGWTASAFLFVTLSTQVVQQWRSHSVQGVSAWLFIGQVLSSVLFIIYSVLGGNWVFVTSNVFILILALVGQGVYWRSRAKQKRRLGA